MQKNLDTECHRNKRIGMIKVLSSLFCLFFLFMNAAFPAQRKFKQLYVASASATSYLKSNWNKYTENYHPNYAFDGNPRTAWVEGEAGQGVNQKLQFEVSSLRTVNRLKLRIRNGYQKSKPLFRKNSSIKYFRFDLLYKEKPVFSKKLLLKKRMGWQNIVVKVPGKRGVDALSLTILSVYPGTKYKDTCLSDIQVFVDSDVIYSKRIEDAKRKRLLDWTKERFKTAAYFKSLPLSYPFASTKFVERKKLRNKKFKNEYKNKNQFYMKKIKEFRAQKDKGWHTAAVARRLKALPDDFYVLHHCGRNTLKTLFSIGEVSFFEAKKQNAGFKETGEYEGEARFSQSQYKLEKYKNKKVNYVYFETKEFFEGREGSSKYHTACVFHYTPTGKLLEGFQYNISWSESEWSRDDDEIEVRGSEVKEGTKENSAHRRGTWLKLEFSRKKKINKVFLADTSIYSDSISFRRFDAQ